MRLAIWDRVLITVLLGFGVGMFSAMPLAAQEDSPDDDGMAELVVRMRFCPDPDSPSCDQNVPSLEWTYLDFVLTNLESGEELPFEVHVYDSGECGCGTVGTGIVTEIPPGRYEVCATENIPGWEIGAVATDGVTVGPDTCLTLTLAADQPEPEGFGTWVYFRARPVVTGLPDTGTGLTAPSAPGAWVPVLMAGALLSFLVGSRLRSRTDG